MTFSHHSRGFTLVELLVVIGIIALLVAILLPVLSRARSQAVLLNCQANQRTMGQALYSYAQSNDNAIPRDGFSGAEMGFYALYVAEELGAQISDMRDLQTDEPAAIEFLRPIEYFKCPALKAEEYVLQYIINGLDFKKYDSTGKYREAWPDPPFAPITECENPSQTVLTVEMNRSRLTPDDLGGFQIYAPSHLPWWTPPSNKAPNPNTTNVRMISHDDARHDGKTTASFFDGHAETMTLAYEDWPRTRINPKAHRDLP